MMYQGPKGYIAKICEVHLQYGNSTTNGRFTLFSSKFHSNIYSILFDYNIQILLYLNGILLNDYNNRVLEQELNFVVKL